MLAIRAAQDPALGARLAEHILRDAAPQPGQSVAGYWPIGTEMDIRHAAARPARPRPTRSCCPSPRPVASRSPSAAGDPATPCKPERFGTVRPIGETGVPDVLLVPLLAWDGEGRRLGYGGGYYDRTLAALPGRRAIGCAYAAQRVVEVPAEAHDATLDAVATEEGLTWFSR